VANAVTLLSLPRVVLGGGVSEALGESFTAIVREAFKQHVFPPELQATEVLTGELGDDAGIVGAAALARQQHASQLSGA
jgi:glucokinase